MRIRPRTAAGRSAAIVLLLIGFALPPSPAPAAVDAHFNPATGHYYKYVRGITTWTQARDLAAAAGGYLVCIGSQAELDWILLNSGIYGSGEIWIGATDSVAEGASEGNWKWINGAYWSFTSWIPGEPNDSGGEHWAEMYKEGAYRGMWNDTLPSAINQGYLIEWDRSPDPPIFPAAPTDLVAELLLDGTIGLAWTDNAVNETEFEVERTTALEPWRGVGRAGADAVSFSDSYLDPVTGYAYRVRARNGAGVSAWSNEAAATSGARIPYPKAPSDLVISAIGTDFMELRWTDNGPGESGYEIHRGEDGDDLAFVAALPPDAVAFRDEGLSPDTVYTYGVRAVGTVQASGFAEASGSTRPNLHVATASGDFRDSPKPGRDSVKVTASWTHDPETSDGTADPVVEGIRLRIGAEESPLSLRIPAGDPGWRGEGPTRRWRSRAGRTPRFSVTVDPEGGLFSLRVKRAELAAPGGTTVRVSLAIGDDAGTERREWEAGKRGGLRLR